MSSRQDDVAAFYVLKAGELERAVRRAITGSSTLVEDACAYAWLQLLRNPQVALDRRGFGWLYVVALREAYRLSDRGRREVALGAPSDLPPTVTDDLDIVVERLMLHQFRVELLRSLSTRKREMVVLHAAGFSYKEIAHRCGVTLRTVERQLLRGKRSLRRRDDATRGSISSSADPQAHS